MRLLPPALGEPDPGGGLVAAMMSGGVDSSVAALLLKEAGNRVVGVTMRLPILEGVEPKCCGWGAARVCRRIGIPHYFIDARDEFERLIIEPFRGSYLEGRTPSPCCDCNSLLKFGLAWDIPEKELGVERVATGHYARTRLVGNLWCIARGSDAERDQSYFLYGTARERIPRLLFPLGEMTKPHVRELARSRARESAERADSQELCFAGEGDYRRALGPAAEPRAGPILDRAGKIIGEHEGIANYTIGQRRGIGLGGGEPLYVVAMDPAANSITVASRPEACRRLVAAREANVLLPSRIEAGARLAGKIRSYGPAAPCEVTEAIEGRLAVLFDEPQFAPAPGQRLVLYDEDGDVVAGGVIA